MDFVVKSLEARRQTAAMYLDLSKAFDRVREPVLARLLMDAGLDEVPTRWVSSFMRGRQQSVTFGGAVSDPGATVLGVPQGSTISPLLFLVYLNGMNSLNLHGTLFTFADDTALAYSVGDEDDLEKVIEEDVQVVQRFLRAMGLILNAGKTKFIVFRYTEHGIAGDSRRSFQIHEEECNDVMCGC